MPRYALVVLILSGLCVLSGCGSGSSMNSNSSMSSPSGAGSGQISGQIVDSFSNAPLPGTFVALEQRDSLNIDRVLRVTTTDAQGNFVFQSVPTGNYDVVAYSSGIGITFYTWMVIFSVPQQASLGMVPLHGMIQAPEGFPGTAQGTVSSAPVAIQSTIWLASAVTQNGTSVLVTIPITASGFLLKTNLPATNLPYGFGTEASLPVFGVFAGNGVSYQNANIATDNQMVIDVQAFQGASSTTADCTPSEQQTSPFIVLIGPGKITSIPGLAFSGCK